MTTLEELKKEKNDSITELCLAKAQGKSVEIIKNLANNTAELEYKIIEKMKYSFSQEILNEQLPISYVSQAFCLADAGKTEKAIEAYQNALNYNPNSNLVLFVENQIKNLKNSNRTISNITFQYLCDRYEKDICDFLDDPETVEPKETYKMLIIIGKDIGKDFWSIAKEQNTNYEIKRLKAILDKNNGL